MKAWLRREMAPLRALLMPVKGTGKPAWLSVLYTFVIIASIAGAANTALRPEPWSILAWIGMSIGALMALWWLIALLFLAIGHARS